VWFEGKSCVACGSTNRLEADHIDRSAKKYNPSALWSMSDSNPNKHAELAKLQVLCYTCHKSKTRGELVAKEHGLAMYERHGCKCITCRAAKATKNAKRN
jgi:hypothetical protein